MAQEIRDSMRKNKMGGPLWESSWICPKLMIELIEIFLTQYFAAWDFHITFVNS